MSNTQILPTLMPTVITSNTTWDAVSPSPRKKPLSVRAYWLPRPRGAFLASELALLAVAMLGTRAGISPQVPLVIAMCGIVFLVQRLDRTIVSSGWLRFSSSLLQGVAFGLAASVGTFRAVAAFGAASRPVFGSDFAPALAGAFAAGLMPLILRPILKQMVRHKKLVERILIVGTGELAGKLYRALASGSDSEDTVYLKEDRSAEVLDFPNVDPAIDSARLHEVIARENISRVILAEKDPQSRSRLASSIARLAPSPDCR